MERVKRFDSGTLQPAVKMPNGWLRASAYLTRVGVFTYVKKDGTLRRELRPPEEVFRADSLSSLRQVPMTLGHPKEGDGLLTAENAKEHTVGNVAYGYPCDDYYVEGPVMVTDKAAVEAVENGTRELSCAYTSRMDATPGVWMGQEYDEVQRDILYNHVSIEDSGRAGSEVRIKMDAQDAIQQQPPKERTVKIKIENNEHDINESAVRDIEKERASHQAKLDSAEARAKKAESELAQSQVKLDAIEQDKRKTIRQSLETEAKAYLPKDTKLDGLDDNAVRAEVIKALRPTAKLDGKSADYVSAYYDAVLGEEKESRVTPTPTTSALSQARADAAPTPLTQPAVSSSPEEARKRQNEENRNAWKQKAK